MGLLRLWGGFLAAALLVSCGNRGTETFREPRDGEAAGRLRIAVTILPQKFFADRIAGDLAEVMVLVAEGQDPHDYQIKPSQIMALGEADFYVTVGVEFEQAFLPSIRRGLPNLEILDGSAGMELIPFSGHSGEEKDEDHRPGEAEEEHSHGQWDPHVWLGTDQMLTFSTLLRDTLASRLPEHRETIEANYRNLLRDIGAMDAEIRETLADCRGAFFFVFHQAYGYFAENYGLNQVVVEAGGKEPSPRQLERLIDRAGREGVRVIFVQPQFSRTSAEIIARAIGGEAAAIDPLVYDWIGNMRSMAGAIARGVSGSGS